MRTIRQICARHEADLCAPWGRSVCAMRQICARHEADLCAPWGRSVRTIRQICARHEADLCASWGRSVHAMRQICAHYNLKWLNKSYTRFQIYTLMKLVQETARLITYPKLASLKLILNANACKNLYISNVISKIIIKNIPFLDMLTEERHVLLKKKTQHDL